MFLGGRWWHDLGMNVLAVPFLEVQFRWLDSGVCWNHVRDRFVFSSSRPIWSFGLV